LAIALAADAKASRRKLRLWLTGRNASRLAESVDQTATLGADASSAVIEISDAPALRDWIRHADAAAPLDMVIANAGRSAGIGAGPESLAQVTTLVETNILGTINTVLPAAACMRTRRHGRIVLLASLAGHLPFPSTPTYSASKAFVRTWGLALRPDLARDGVLLTVVSPGYIDTPMTAGNDFRMPFLLTAEQAAAHILRRLRGGPAEIVFPFAAALSVRILSLLPSALFGRLALRRPHKHALRNGP
jgi:short-subunit dehydrogenase